MFELDSKNGLRTKMFIQNGRIITKAYCITKTGKQMDYYFPAESAPSWYPLFPYYNYYYIPTYNDILLVVDDKAPKYIRQNLSNKHIHLKNMYNFKDDKVKVKHNLILDTNLGLDLKLKKEGFVTWTMPYHLSDIKDNQEKVNNTIDSINEKILARQEGSAGLIEHRVNSETYNYATKSELSQLLELGCAINMNNYMKKVALVIEG